MITSYKNRYGLLCLTGFLVTVGAWTFLASHAFAQDAGTITINTGLLIVPNDTSISNSNGVLSSGGSLSPGGNITISATNLILTGSGTNLTSSNGASIDAGGNISINTGTLPSVRRVPESSSILGLMAFVAVGVTSIYKSKQRSKQL